MIELNNLLSELRQQWLDKKNLNINLLISASDIIRNLNRKENKPLIIKLDFYKLNQLKSITGVCSYINLLVGNKLVNSYVTGEIRIWKKIKKISRGKRIFKKIYIEQKIKIPIYNLVSIQSNTIPSILKKYI